MALGSWFQDLVRPPLSFDLDFSSKSLASCLFPLDLESLSVVRGGMFSSSSIALMPVNASAAQPCFPVNSVDIDSILISLLTSAARWYRRSQNRKAGWIKLLRALCSWSPAKAHREDWLVESVVHQDGRPCPRSPGEKAFTYCVCLSHTSGPSP